MAWRPWGPNSRGRGTGLRPVDTPNLFQLAEPHWKGMSLDFNNWDRFEGATDQRLLLMEKYLCRSTGSKKFDNLKDKSMRRSRSEHAVSAMATVVSEAVDRPSEKLASASSSGLLGEIMHGTRVVPPRVNDFDEVMARSRRPPSAGPPERQRWKELTLSRSRPHTVGNQRVVEPFAPDRYDWHPSTISDAVRYGVGFYVRPGDGKTSQAA